MMAVILNAILPHGVRTDCYTPYTEREFRALL